MALRPELLPPSPPPPYAIIVKIVTPAGTMKLVCPGDRILGDARLLDGSRAPRMT